MNNQIKELEEQVYELILETDEIKSKVHESVNELCLIILKIKQKMVKLKALKGEKL